jgi:hypothetical protein
MARIKFNLDLQLTNSFTMMVHGIRASGKTYLIGDMLAHERQHGPVCFVNMAGEDGAASVRSFGLGEIGETLETYDDFKAFCRDYAGKKLRAVGLDSISVLGKAVMKSVIGADRLPRITKESNEWGEFHREMDTAMTLLRNTAERVLAVCPSDRSVDAVTQRTYISPDLPGRQAVGSAGWFDFVAYLQADVVGPATVSRKLIIAPNSTIVVRQRLAKQIVKDIVLPNGPGGWKIIVDTIAEHAQVQPQPAATQQKG